MKANAMVKRVGIAVVIVVVAFAAVAQIGVTNKHKTELEFVRSSMKAPKEWCCNFTANSDVAAFMETCMGLKGYLVAESCRDPKHPVVSRFGPPSIAGGVVTCYYNDNSWLDRNLAP